MSIIVAISYTCFEDICDISYNILGVFATLLFPKSSSSLYGHISYQLISQYWLSVNF